VKSGKHGRTGGGAERAGGVCPFEKHPPFSEAFKIRRFIKSGMAIKSGVRPAQIVRHDKNDIWFCREGSAKYTKNKYGLEQKLWRTDIHKYCEGS
jgi:hypothetical protein